jgi:hypothetical protein
MAALGPNRLRQVGLATVVIVAAAAVLLILAQWSRSADNTLTYNGRSLDAWFYGSRTNFFHYQTGQAAQEALDALGTNAFPFLLTKLKGSRGNGPIYFRLYRSLPPQIQPHLPYPISSDDIKMVSLRHLEKLLRLDRDQVQALVDSIPGLANPRLRMAAVGVMSHRYETDPAYLRLSRRLLDDPHPGLQLEGAIAVAESSLIQDPHEPRLFPILLDALEHKQPRDAAVDISDYRYEQQPPGGSGRSPFPFTSPFIVPPDQALRNRIELAAVRLELHLSRAEKDRLETALKDLHRGK